MFMSTHISVEKINTLNFTIYIMFKLHVVFNFLHIYCKRMSLTGHCDRIEHPVHRECDLHHEKHSGDEDRPALWTSRGHQHWVPNAGSCQVRSPHIQLTLSPLPWNNYWGGIFQYKNYQMLIYLKIQETFRYWYTCTCWYTCRYKKKHFKVFLKILVF